MKSHEDKTNNDSLDSSSSVGSEKDFSASLGSEDIKSLIQENLRLNKEMYEMLKVVKRHAAWQKVFGFLKLLIILVPVVLGILYLPPILQEGISKLQGTIEKLQQY